MKTRELIEKLKQMDQEAEVLLGAWDDSRIWAAELVNTRPMNLDDLPHCPGLPMSFNAVVIE